jgi:hypothetical protein
MEFSEGAVAPSRFNHQRGQDMYLAKIFTLVLFTSILGATIERKRAFWGNRVSNILHAVSIGILLSLAYLSL